MNTGFHRLHALRMENDARGFEMDEIRPRFERIANRHENGTAPVAVSAFQLFQTPAEIASRMVELLSLSPGARVLEPSAGLGRILDALRPFGPSEVVAVESSEACAGQLFVQDRSGVTIKQRDFLTLSPADIGMFDAVVMNPPFHMRSDIRHIEHARQFVRPGGRIVALCMDTSHRRKQLMPQASFWEEVPAGAFKNEGTKIATCLGIYEIN